MSSRKVIGRKTTSTNLDALISTNNSDGIIEKSPIDGKDIRWERLEIPSEEVFQKCEKSIYNKRSFDDLSLASVLDIYASIKASNGNTEPVRVELVDGKYQILGGLRRAYTVSIIPGSKLKVIVAKGLTDKERAHFAKVMDEYAEPSYMDKAKSITDLKNKLEQKNRKELTGLELSDILGMKKSNVYYALSYAKIPTEIISLFPALKFVSTPLLRELVKYNKDGYLEKLSEYFTAIEPIALTGQESAEEISNIEDSLYEASKRLQKEILLKMREDHKKPIDPIAFDSKFKNLADISLPGIKVKPTKSGVNISINEKQVNEEVLAQIMTVLERVS